MTPVTGTNEGGYLFVRIYCNRKVKTIALAKLVWLSVVLRPVPNGFEIHHRDTDNTNNTWGNLFCLHELDHRKLHGRELIDDQELNEVPF